MRAEVKELITQRFDHLTTLMNGHFKDVDERLGKIEVQTGKTNGRVTDIEKRELTHNMTCPAMPKIDKINDSLETYRIILKRPKFFISVLVVLVILALATFVAENPLIKLHNIFDPQQTIELPQ